MFWKNMKEKVDQMVGPNTVTIDRGDEFNMEPESGVGWHPEEFGEMSDATGIVLMGEDNDIVPGAVDHRLCQGQARADNRL